MESAWFQVAGDNAQFILTGKGAIRSGYISLSR
jgi:hypothetical protein